MTNGQTRTEFDRDYYLFRRKVFKLFGGAFHVYGRNDELLFYSRQKAFKLREDLRLYSDESRSEELLTIKTAQVLDIGAKYDVQDSTTGEVVGSIKRRGLKSILRDEWDFLDRNGAKIGTLIEESALAALVSRVFELVPQTYTITAAGGGTVARIKQRFNPFILKYEMTIHDGETAIDRRLLIAAGVLLAGIEGRQQ